MIKAIRLSMVCLLLNMPFFVLGQTKYSDGVLRKMDENKTAGLNSFSGIQKMFSLKLDGCGSKEKALGTVSLISSKLPIEHWEFIEPGHIKIYCSYDSVYDLIRQALDPYKIEIFWNEEYYVVSSK